MEFKKIIDMQKDLDQAIESAHKIDKEKVINQKIVALLVELGEFANEYAPFKYWKKNKNISRDKVIEEFIDGIHFFISLHDFLKIKTTKIDSIIYSNDMTEQLLATFNKVSSLMNNLNEDILLEAFGLYMGNARLLKITNEEIEKHYLNKNKINYERIANNY